MIFYEHEYKYVCIRISEYDCILMSESEYKDIRIYECEYEFHWIHISKCGYEFFCIEIFVFGWINEY